MTKRNPGMSEERIENYLLGKILSDREARSIENQVRYFLVSLSYHPAGVWVLIGCFTFLASKVLFSDFFEGAHALLVYGPWMWAAILLGMGGYDGRTWYRHALSFLSEYEHAKLESIAVQYPRVKSWLDHAADRGCEPRYKDYLGALEYKLLKEYGVR